VFPHGVSTVFAAKHIIQLILCRGAFTPGNLGFKFIAEALVFLGREALQESLGSGVGKAERDSIELTKAILAMRGVRVLPNRLSRVQYYQGRARTV